MSGNGFNQNSDSDCIDSVDNPSELAAGILDEMSLPADGILDFDLLLRKWKNRLLLQFPSRFADADACRRLGQSLEEALRLVRRGAATRSCNT